ncbi:hypothetical protein J15TS10_24740 [Paenibacillus woosongensis]|uniref:Uncharacterized protein n=1 Tax=Paenibacillus woosongensis TaxID=307580 RepID=A0ABQ4MSZ0_9BACL|nr:hypothetical protein J15TS10_24740 [Paenibacillus woosongensis]
MCERAAALFLLEENVLTLCKHNDHKQYGYLLNHPHIPKNQIGCISEMVSEMHPLFSDKIFIR